MSLLKNPEARRFTLFLAVGGLNTVVGYSIFAILIWLGAGPAGAAVGSTILGALFNFRSIGRLVFKSGDYRLLPRFLAVYAAQCSANICLLHLAERAGITTLVAEAFILPILAVLTYLAMRRFVFADLSSRNQPR
jgi:putative flippase GtrA